VSGTTVVLVHGGTLTSTMWDPVRACLSTPSVALDLPGRRYRPADLAEVTVDDWVASVCDDIAAGALDDVVLVAHSSGGYVLPGVAARLTGGRPGGPRVALRALVFVSATVPADGTSPADYLREDIRALALETRDAMVARASGCTIGGLRPGEPAIETELEVIENGPRMGVEAPRPLFEPVSWAGFPREVPRTYVRCLRDKVIAPELADQMVVNMGGASVVDFDGGHRSYETHPAELAAVIDQCCNAAAKVAP